LDKKEFELLVDRIRTVNDVVSTLDVSIRREAFVLLTGYIKGNTEGTDLGGAVDETVGLDDAEKLVLEFGSNKPHENVKLVAAYLYSRFGRVAIGIDHIKRVAADFGLTIPKRPDMTLRQAKRDKKKLFTVQGGSYTLTIHGEVFLKDTFGVSKGKLPLPEGDDE